MLKLSNHIRYSHCPLCQTSAIQKLGDIRYYSPILYSTTLVTPTYSPELWQCGHCLSGFTQNIIPESDAIALYQQGDSSERFGHGYSPEPKTKIVTTVLKSLFQPGTKILDIGCNTGDILDFGLHQGCQTAGVEYSQSSLEILRKKGHQAFPSLQAVDGVFDVITAFDLVEHLYDVPTFLETCRKLLTSAGHLVILTGDFQCVWAKMTQTNWWYVRYPEHIVFPARSYFEMHPDWQLVDWVPTYADRVYDRPKHLVFFSILKRLALRDYSGLPALSPDHALIILKHA